MNPTEPNTNGTVGPRAATNGAARPAPYTPSSTKLTPQPPAKQPPNKPSREDLAPGEVLCDHCTAKCCRYFALAIDAPEEFADFEILRWYLLHGDVAVFTEEDTWYLLVFNVCRHLQADHRCGIYTTRPQICRDYTTDNCEFDDTWVYDRYLETPEQVAEYAEAVLPRGGKKHRGGQNRRGQSIRSPRPPLLPVIETTMHHAAAETRGRE
jgi:Fe-S-cluster containining protein